MSSPFELTPAPDDPADLGRWALAELRPELEAWLDANGGLGEDVDAGSVVDVLAACVGAVLATRDGAAPVATGFTAAEVDDLKDRILPELAAAMTAELDDDAVGAAVAAEIEDDLALVWWHYLRYLAESGRWTGTEAELDAVLARLEPAEPELHQALAEAAVEVERVVEDTATTGSFPMVAARVLLARVGEGIDVPAEEDLTPEQVAEVLEDVEDRLPVLADDPAADGEPRRAEDVPWLRQVLLDLVDLDVLQLDAAGTRLTPGRRAALLDGPDDESRALRRSLVGRFVLQDPDSLDGGFAVSEAVVPTMLAAAAHGRPFGDDDLEHLVERVAQLGPLADAAADEVRDRLADLAVFGIVSAESPWTVEPGYLPAIATAAEELAGDVDELQEVLGAMPAEFDEGMVDAVADRLGLADDQRQQIKDILGEQ
ncbi:hypothetical protein ACFFKU_03405 [Kineococcus gynurae]|uniref:Tellurite resistance protein TerB n=1 Tax=Kineococcus gynurae TaxID=452979 RepID=A0ABV5LS17_9ACTN